MLTLRSRAGTAQQQPVLHVLLQRRCRSRSRTDLSDLPHLSAAFRENPLALGIPGKGQSADKYHEVQAQPGTCPRRLLKTGCRTAGLFPLFRQLGSYSPDPILQKELLPAHIQSMRHHRPHPCAGCQPHFHILPGSSAASWIKTSAGIPAGPQKNRQCAPKLPRRSTGGDRQKNPARR